MGTIKFFLFGKFYVKLDDRLIQEIEPYKAKELLVYLLLHRDQPQSREHLADILWGEIELEQSKSYLRKAIWQLQSILERRSGRGILLVDGDWLQINPHFDFWLDIEILNKIFKDTQGIRGKDLQEGQAKSIRDATDLYQGDLLVGWYQDWCLYERERLQYLFLAMLDKLMDYCEIHKDFENGLLFGERILQYDRARERTHRHLMRLYQMVGDRTAALRQYQKCVTALKKELEVEPAESTRLLYEMIRGDKFETQSQPNHVHKNKNSETEETLNMLFSHLSTLHKSLSELETQITQDMQTIQNIIRISRF